MDRSTVADVPEWVARYYELYSTSYEPDSESALARVEHGLSKVLKQLPPKGSKVLDLCCGGGAYLFALEKAGYKMTGLDLQETMINRAKEKAKQLGSEAKLVVGDAKSPDFPDESFDAVVFLGAPFGHFTLEEFETVAIQARRMLRSRGIMVAEVNDHIALFLSGSYQRVLYDPSGDQDDIISLHTKYDNKQGTFNRLYVDFATNRRFKGVFHIWSPWILHYVMKKAGFERKFSEPSTFGTTTEFVSYEALKD